LLVVQQCRDGPELDGAQHPGQHFGTVVEQHAHAVTLLHTRSLQGMGATVGPGIEIGVGPAPLSAHHGRSVWVAGSSLGEGLPDGAQAGRAQAQQADQASQQQAQIGADGAPGSRNPVTETNDLGRGGRPFRSKVGHRGSLGGSQG
jgi:hypothetical protein